MGEDFNETIVGGRGPFRPSDQPMESENETLHFRRPQWHPYYRSSADRFNV